jgi:hypothetical protein
MFRMFSRIRARFPRAAGPRQPETKFLALGAPLGFVLADGYVSQAWNGALHFIYGLDRQAWLLVLCGVVIIGAFCLRGFGSRSNY